MSLDPKTVALQGFLKTPLALAIQGLIDLEVTPPDETGDIFPIGVRRRYSKREDEEIILLVM